MATPAEIEAAARAGAVLLQAHLGYAEARQRREDCRRLARVRAAGWRFTTDAVWRSPHGRTTIFLEGAANLARAYGKAA